MVNNKTMNTYNIVGLHYPTGWSQMVKVQSDCYENAVVKSKPLLDKLFTKSNKKYNYIITERIIYEK